MFNLYNSLPAVHVAILLLNQMPIDGFLLFVLGYGCLGMNDSAIQRRVRYSFIIKIRRNFSSSASYRVVDSLSWLEHREKRIFSAKIDLTSNSPSSPHGNDGRFFGYILPFPVDAIIELVIYLILQADRAEIVSLSRAFPSFSCQPCTHDMLHIS